MTVLEVIKLVLQLLLKIPDILKFYKKTKNMGRYNDENKRISNAIEAYISGKTEEERLNALNELEK